MKHQRTPNSDLDTIIPLLIASWRRYRKENGPPDSLQTREFRRVVSAVQKLQAMSDDGQSLIGTDYFSDPELLGSYLLYQWVVHYLQGLSIINELPKTPKRVLDVCSGPTPMAFAALRHGAREVIATDQNIAALELGADICGRYGMPMSIRHWNCLNKSMPVTGQFDLIILGHCLEELFPGNHSTMKEKQNRFITSLLDRLTPDGFLMIIDSSHLESNTRVLQIRDHFVQNGVPVQAPCVWRGECPALKTKNSPCYAQREFEKPKLIKEIQRAANINLGSLKMSYIIFRNPTAQWPQLPDKKLYRIISPPVESFQGTRYYLCGTDGKKNLGSHLSLHPPESRAFEYLSRGELISIENALETNHMIDIVQGTKVSVEAACGKPIVEKEQDH